ncbi:hypothetical protein C8F04DRAFT_1188529 [Mycena alexandri]|uniref:Uncharacterized protein n=1 Tax=Mycena alexandri TaxID=1745969 RepID=A0AAD6SIA9_9AGAR|nr:hypothetical protein C8F04DRAFT_1188529 [Mycena alexandri]
MEIRKPEISLLFEARRMVMGVMGGLWGRGKVRAGVDACGYRRAGQRRPRPRRIACLRCTWCRVAVRYCALIHSCRTAYGGLFGAGCARRAIRVGAYVWVPSGTGGACVAVHGTRPWGAHGMMRVGMPIFVSRSRLPMGDASCVAWRGVIGRMRATILQLWFGCYTGYGQASEADGLLLLHARSIRHRLPGNAQYQTGACLASAPTLFCGLPWGGCECECAGALDSSRAVYATDGDEDEDEEPSRCWRKAAARAVGRGGSGQGGRTGGGHGGRTYVAVCAGCRCGMRGADRGGCIRGCAGACMRAYRPTGEGRIGLDYIVRGRVVTRDGSASASAPRSSSRVGVAGARGANVLGSTLGPRGGECVRVLAGASPEAGAGCAEAVRALVTRSVLGFTLERRYAMSEVGMTGCRGGYRAASERGVRTDARTGRVCTWRQHWMWMCRDDEAPESVLALGGRLRGCHSGAARGGVGGRGGGTCAGVCALHAWDPGAAWGIGDGGGARTSAGGRRMCDSALGTRDPVGLADSLSLSASMRAIPIPAASGADQTAYRPGTGSIVSVVCAGVALVLSGAVPPVMLPRLRKSSRDLPLEVDSRNWEFCTDEQDDDQVIPHSKALASEANLPHHQRLRPTVRHQVQNLVDFGASYLSPRTMRNSLRGNGAGLNWCVLGEVVGHLPSVFETRGKNWGEQIK